MKTDLSSIHIAVIGLGYVGMPLALNLAKNMKTTGFDISAPRIDELKKGIDRNREIPEVDLKATSCSFTTSLDDIKDCTVYIVTVPTPIDSENNPDLGPVEAASRAVAGILKKGDIVVYESTVYPGVTEDFCGPLLENGSGLKCGVDFFLGYSPERINPGDAVHSVQNITKVVSGQTPEVTDFLCSLYGTINGGNIFKARNIKVAEAAKVIENAQRDINVAFINEVTMILNKLDLSAYDVLEAASTKWNFLKFVPGLVGGHCIGVDPYYLAQCAQKLGHEPEVILAGRKINDGMGFFVADRIDYFYKALPKASKNPRALLLGFTFKENINDVRNSKVGDIAKRLMVKGYTVDIHDPHAHPETVRHEYGLDVVNTMPSNVKYDVAALLVSHNEYKAMDGAVLSRLMNQTGLIFDLKGLWRGLTLADGLLYRSL